jgi:hypothetical protein
LYLELGGCQVDPMLSEPKNAADICMHASHLVAAITLEGAREMDAVSAKASASLPTLMLP